MSGAWSHRHAASPRESSKPESPTYREAGRLSRVRIDENKAEVPDDEAERLAQKIVEGRIGQEQFVEEAARDLGSRDAKRQDGHVFPGSDAARAQAVKASKDNPSSPMHKVAEKVREKVEAVEERVWVEPHAFVGPNPGGLHGDKNPDVVKE
ncbi:polynucleotide adenylyltransferase [Micractinium conductrix]|uniref:Polynucleotide adenylyltransferase n=1 Tax=Micractinium conductrix TaxID=554055 RepID=A0A2P6VRE5_9CHLO|nr:polynucleotide adenylyltransferase [Micractinium conductrix]|eukprot:PSC76637.1 polynucleotide adenylyltransferase [Micractinium conductrix]